MEPTIEPYNSGEKREQGKLAGPEKKGKLGSVNVKQWFDEANSFLSDLFGSNVKTSELDVQKIDLELQNLQKKEQKKQEKLRNPKLEEEKQKKLLADLKEVRGKIFDLREKRENAKSIDERLDSFLNYFQLELVPRITADKISDYDQGLRAWKLNEAGKQIKQLKEVIEKHGKKHPEYKAKLKEFEQSLEFLELLTKNLEGKVDAKNKRKAVRAKLIKPT